MANRPIYIASKEKKALIETKSIEFKWHSGLSISQKQKSINSLHESAKETIELNNILEISSKSKSSIGIQLSAFNLKLKNKENIKGSVEVFFQGSKVFLNGGPYTDLYFKSSIVAKRDSRLKRSGELIEFYYEDKLWPLNPSTLFYTWLYINALLQNQLLAEKLLQYDAFSDIEFNPKKSINCQAAAAAIYKSLDSKSLINYVMESADNFIEVFNQFTEDKSMTQSNLF